jgi:triacylglycerol lipase
MAFLLALVAGLAGAAPAGAQGPALATPTADLERALACTDGIEGAGRDPVLLVHGTGTNPRESWRSGYAYALPREGIPTCTVELPDRSMDDIQVSSEFVVFAIRRIAERSGRRVAVVGHSQGGLQPLWALRFWPDLADRVSDLVGVAAPYGGTATATASCRAACQAAIWQMRQGSAFLGALLGAPLPGGPAYTSIGTVGDGVVEPAPEAMRLPGARNVILQEVCPGRPVNHFTILYDNLTYRLVLDALGHDGPSDPARIGADVCLTDQMPTNQETIQEDTSQGSANFLAAFRDQPTVSEEPRLFCYADPQSTRGVGTVCPAQAGQAPDGDDHAAAPAPQRPAARTPAATTGPAAATGARTVAATRATTRTAADVAPAATASADLPRTGYDLHHPLLAGSLLLLSGLALRRAAATSARSSVA